MKAEAKLFNKTYLLLILVNLITAFGYSMIATLISSYAVTLGAGLTMAGALAGLFSLSALCIRPVSGIAIDLVNKWNLCILSALLICISFLGYALVPGIVGILFFRVLHGIAFGINGTVSMVLVSEAIPSDRLGEGLGYFGIGQIIAQICGPNIGMAIRSRFGFHNLFFIASVLTVLAIFLLVYMKKTVPVPRTVKKDKAVIRLNNLVAKECVVYALIAGLFSLGNGITSSFLVLVGEERNIANIVLFFTVNAMILLVMRFLIGKLVDRTSLTWIVNISLLLTAASMIMIGKAGGLVLILMAAVFKAIGQGGGQISLQTACIKKADAARVGIATSTYYIGADIGQGFGPMIGGKLSEVYGYKIMFYCTGALMLLGVAAFNIYQKNEKGKNK